MGGREGGRLLHTDKTKLIGAKIILIISISLSFLKCFLINILK
jgi:hypothetical protein